ncbi:SDR family oxidoreductase [Rhizobium halophytocola]|uniref:Nucleoside-diphosphate-sugar epimerase n=1 Tax=Rhizobium halophytocola TaxID=735519 RepID=A0ABS4DVZ6_9HYPH|nr:SDR family oxidoreductase [Rhizobium halophytocola]MBP1849876.1 nucleoside-diphosphate-sugar epimerase [Rhizobium halophytocola]
MRIFVTGASGFIGSRVVTALIGAGHQVIGMTRSEAGAESLKAAGAEPYHASLEEPDTLLGAVDKADGVIHLAFDHDFSRFVENCQKDARVIAALGQALKGSDRPMLITSGTGIGSPSDGGPAREDIFNTDHPNPRIASEMAGNALLDEGVNLSVVRLPQVHDPVRQGLISPLLDIVREKGVSGYVGEGRNRWPAGHVEDVAQVYRLAIERAVAGARYHAVAEEGIPARDIAEALARGMKVEAVSVAPEDVQAHFGWMGIFVGLDMQATSEWTRQTLGWNPTGPTLLEDLAAMRY